MVTPRSPAVIHHVCGSQGPLATHRGAGVGNRRIRRRAASGRNGRRVGTSRLIAARAVPGVPLINRDGGSRQTCRQEPRCDENCNPRGIPFHDLPPLQTDRRCLTQHVCSRSKQLSGLNNKYHINHSVKIFPGIASDSDVRIADKYPMNRSRRCREDAPAKVDQTQGPSFFCSFRASSSSSNAAPPLRPSLSSLRASASRPDCDSATAR